MEPHLRIIDSHAHIWDLDQLDYPWLTSEAGLLYRTFDERELRQQLDSSGIHEAILVQAANSTVETDYLLRVAARSSVVTGVVGWVPLEHPVDAGDALGRASRDPLLVGVRHLNHDEPDPEWLLTDRVVESLGLAAALGVPLDVVATGTSRLRSIAALSERLPDLRIVVDHLGGPPVGTEDWADWKDLITDISANRNVSAKLSGLTTRRLPGPVSDEDLQHCVAVALEVFGPARLMYGGDWPVSLLASDYATLWARMRWALRGLDEPELGLVLGGTARSFYGLRTGD